MTLESNGDFHNLLFLRIAWLKKQKEKGKGNNK